MIRAIADARATLETLVGEPLDAAEVSSAVEAALSEVVGFDGWCLFGTDPHAGLRITQFGGRGTDYTSDLARNEALMSDVNRYGDLASRRVPGGWLSADHPGASRSFRFHEVIRPSGFRSELRFVLRDGAGVWGGLSLFTESKEQPYGDDALRQVAALAAPLTGTIRRFPARDVLRRGAAPPAGVVAVCATRGVVSVSEGARQWLDDLVPGGEDHTTAENMTRVVLDAAYALRRGDAARTAVCLRTVRGHWLRVEAMPLKLGPADVAVTFSEASVSHVATTMSSICGLTDRERQVMDLLLRGGPAKQIARHLDISVLTLNGHLRAIYRKYGVRGRDELYARLS
jgi:DNA-binding CsgD family transcriptional regulator